MLGENIGKYCLVQLLKSFLAQTALAGRNPSSWEEAHQGQCG